MPAIPVPSIEPAATGRAPVNRSAAHRATVNRSNAQHSTGPRTGSGKQRSSLNALRHGLTASSPMLPSEDPAAYENHRREFLQEYQPATPTETQLVQELIDTSWRLNRLPKIETEMLAAQTAIDVHALALLAHYSNRLSRQFQKALEQLRDLQAGRRDGEGRRLKEAASLLELHKHKGIPWQPADDGFVFSKEEVERAAAQFIRQNHARDIGYVRFDMSPQAQYAISHATS